MYSGFLTGSDAAQDRLLARAGFIGVAALVLAVVLTLVLRPVFDQPGADRLVFSIDTPVIGVGVEKGTPVMLRGVQVGTVEDISISGDGMPRIELDVERNGVGPLYEDFGFDFRPQNYFGVTAVNILDSGSSETGRLATGSTIRRAAARDYTMGTMIEFGSQLVDGTMQQPMMDAITRSPSRTPRRWSRW